MDHTFTTLVAKRKKAPRFKLSLAAFLRGRTSEEVNKTYIIAAGNHWHLVHGRKVTCGLLQKWTWISNAKKRRGAVTTLFEITGEGEVDGNLVRKVEALEQERKERKDRAAGRREAMALIKSLGCTHEHEKDQWGEEVKVYAPDGYRYRRTGEQMEFFDRWEEVVTALNGKTKHMLLVRDRSL